MIHTLHIDSVMLSFGLKPILSNVYLSCETGKVTGLLGRNGEGKSCLMKIIYGELAGESKSIRFDNQAIFDTNRRPDLLTYLPQKNFIPPSLTLQRIFLDFDLSFDELVYYFPEFATHRKSKLSSLSGGQRRVIEVYVIIQSSSQFSMLDEPYLHLMPMHIEKINKLLLEKKKNKGFLLTDHAYHYVLDCCDTLYVLTDGQTRLANGMSDLQKWGYVR